MTINGSILHLHLHNLLLELYSGRTPTPGAIQDFLGREIVATPFGGRYGQAGWVLCVNGSPPRGCVVAIETSEHRTQPPAIFYLEMDKSRRLGSAQADIVRRYIAYLESADRNSPVDAGERWTAIVADSETGARRESEAGIDTQPTPRGTSPSAIIEDVEGPAPD